MRDAPQYGFSLLILWIRSRRLWSIFGRPTLFRDFQRQNALKPARCHLRTVSGLTTWMLQSRLGQSLVIQTSNARSPPKRRTRGGARLKAMRS